MAQFMENDQFFIEVESGTVPEIFVNHNMVANCSAIRALPGHIWIAEVFYFSGNASGGEVNVEATQSTLVFKMFKNEPKGFVHIGVFPVADRDGVVFFAGYCDKKQGKEKENGMLGDFHNGRIDGGG